MKPKILFAALVLLMLASTPANAVVTDDPKKVQVNQMSEADKAARLQQIQIRAEQIRAMNKSGLTKLERKALKKELRDMNKEAKVLKGGVYLSVGAILIIILVLILIL